MKKIVSYFLTLYCLINGHNLLLANENGLRQLTRATQNAQLIKAKFTQTKRIAFIKKELVSKGTMAYGKNVGLIWQTINPINTYILATPSGVYQRGNQQKLSPIKDAVAGITAKILVAVISGNTDAVNKHFIVSCTKQKSKTWEVCLKPKNAQISNNLTEIRLVGNQHLHSITLKGKNHQTELKFEQFFMQNTPLTDEQKIQFSTHQ